MTALAVAGACRTQNTCFMTGDRGGSEITPGLILRQSSVAIVSVDDSGVIQSESRPEYLEDPCNMRGNFSLLRDSCDEGASPWDVGRIVLQFIDVIDRLVMCF